MDDPAARAADTFGGFRPAIPNLLRDTASNVLRVGEHALACSTSAHYRRFYSDAQTSQGKARVKVTASGKKVSYGQAGRPRAVARGSAGTSKGDAYCARSAGDEVPQQGG